MALNSSFTVIAFSGVLWSISPLLFAVAVLYAACGSFVTFVLGRPLIKLNSNQLDKEASFRSSLIHVRENAESIMTTRREERQAARLLYRLDDLVVNFRQITAINRNVGFFATGYNWLIQIIPALIIAPAFIRGDVEFGVIIQSSIAFTSLVAAFSLIVTQFQSLSTFAAVVARLSSLIEAFEQSQSSKRGFVEIVETEGRLAYEGLTLLSGTDHEPLLKDLSISVPPGRRVLLTGSNSAAGTALFRATAGASVAGTGRILRPGAGGILFLPERPYLPPGTLRQLLVRAARGGEIPDERILELLHDLDLQHVIAEAGGLDAEQDWGNRLSLQEQQAVAIAHVLLEAPQFVLLDQIGSELSPEQIRRILHMLSEKSIACVNIGEADSRDLYDAVLEYGKDGSWKWTTARG
jgi:putative ATP-binding cassette transporter